ncbi:hypothetical protein HQ535_12285 [bacterium]|nr:hypothetical protein [bacterium]
MPRRSDLDVINTRRRSSSLYGRPSPVVSFITRVLVLILVVGAVVGVVIGGLALWRAITEVDTVEFQVLGIDGPMAGATVIAPDQTEITAGDEPAADIAFTAPGVVSVRLPGYESADFQVDQVPPESRLFLQMTPVVLQGRVLGPGGVGLADASVRLHDLSTVTGEFGGFELTAAAPGTLEVEKKAWEVLSMEWDGAEGRLDVAMEPFVVRGLRVDGEAAGNSARFEDLLNLAEDSMVNTLVFDTKEERGYVLYDSAVPEASEIGAIRDTYDPAEVLAAAKERGLYTITRIVTFQDPFRSVSSPEHAITDAATGGIWTNDAGYGWMDPTDPGAWEYPIALAVEACELGFDEVQFDYVRFPTDGDTQSTLYDVGVDSTVRVESIATFLDTARTALHERECALSADIFAIVLSVPDDQGLGQRPEDLSWAVDAISPMIYPSHYGPGWLGFDNPNDHPSDVVESALELGTPRLIGGAIMRPWLQSFGYSAEQISVQIDQAESLASGWLLWNAVSEFVAASLPRE